MIELLMMGAAALGGSFGHATDDADATPPPSEQTEFSRDDYVAILDAEDFFKTAEEGIDPFLWRVNEIATQNQEAISAFDEHEEDDIDGLAMLYEQGPIDWVGGELVAKQDYVSQSDGGVYPRPISAEVRASLLGMIV